MNPILADKLQLWGFEDDFIIFSDGSFGFGLEISQLDIDCLSDEAVNALAERTSQFLNGLPVSSDIQFVKTVVSGSNDLLQGHLQLAQTSQNDIAKVLTQERVKRLHDLEAGNLLPKHHLYVFVRRKSQGPLFQKPKFFSRPKLFEKMGESILTREIVTTQSLRDHVARGLSTLGIQSKTLNADTLANIIYRQWNPSRPTELSGYDSEDIRSSLLFSDVAISEKGFVIGDTHYRIVSLKILPERTHAAMSRAFLDLPLNSSLFLTINVPDQQREVESLQTQRRLAFSMARGKREGVSDIESESKFQDLETLLSEMIAQGEKVFHVSLNVVLQSQGTEELNDQVAHTLLKFRELAGV